MFFNGEVKRRVPLGDGEIEQDLRDPLSLKRDAQATSLINGYLLEAKVLVIKAQKRLIDARDREVEIPLSSCWEIQSQVTLGLEELDVMSTQVNDRPVDPWNDHKVPELAIYSIKLDPQGPWTFIKPQSWDRRLQATHAKTLNPSHVATQLLGYFSWQLEQDRHALPIDAEVEPSPGRQIRLTE